MGSMVPHCITGAKLFYGDLGGRTTKYWVRRGVRVGRSYLDKDTHTWRWWPRRVVTRILQPADTGQEEADMMGEEEEVQEKKKKVKKEEETR